MHVHAVRRAHAVRRVHAVTPKLVICVMYFNVNLTDSFDDRRSQSQESRISTSPVHHGHQVRPVSL